MQRVKNFLFRSKTLTVVVSVILLLLIISWSSLNSSFNKINYQEQTPDADNSTNKIGNELKQNSTILDENMDPLTNKNIVNILLIGQDKRPGEENARSDSMIIATVNKNSNSIKLTSLMRDMYVRIPGYANNKINSAYAFGGMDLLTETVEENFLIAIDGCIEVDFSRFEKIIDKISGIEIELNKYEAYYLSSSSLRLKEGINILTGKTALEYARIRYIGNDDYERTERQRNVLVAVYDKLKDSDIKTLLELADDILPMVTTNLTKSQILSLVTNIFFMDISDIETYRIPADGKFVPTTIQEMSVLVPDISENRLLLKEYIGY
jgi:LCP family protein required for cell wall assembly